MTIDLVASTFGVGLLLLVYGGVILHLGYMAYKVGWTIIPLLVGIWWVGWGDGTNAMFYLVFGEFTMTHSALTGTVITDGPVSPDLPTFSQLMGVTQVIVRPDYYHSLHVAALSGVAILYMMAYDKWKEAKAVALQLQVAKDADA